MNRGTKWGERLARLGGVLILLCAMRSDGGAPLWEVFFCGGIGCILLLAEEALRALAQAKPEAAAAAPAAAEVSLASPAPLGRAG